MLSLKLGLAQVIVIAIYVVNMIIASTHHGEQQPPYNAWATLAGTVFGIAILYWGGFFS